MTLKPIQLENSITISISITRLQTNEAKSYRPEEKQKNPKL
jgi:hypothetical protein